MDDRRKTVAIIGAGVSGLTSIKACIEENLIPVCFEKERSIGGLWNYNENPDQFSVYKSATINTSRAMTGYSDFPIPKRYSIFMPHREIWEYLHLYAAHFELYKYIRFNASVVQVSKAENYEVTGQWIVTYCTDGVEVNSMIFDSVWVCNGHLWFPSYPRFDGMELFEGVQIHSHSYKNHYDFKDKKVLVVGLGNSAADIATELSHCASQVYLSTRTGGWVISRLSNQGVPWDHCYERRIYNKLPTKILELMFLKWAQARFDHESYGVRPRHGILNAPAIISDELPHRIANGSLKLTPNVLRFTKTGVVFKDGSIIDDLDVVIFCTGYKIAFPFLSDKFIKVEDNNVNLYKYMFPPDHTHPTMVFIGLVQSSGALLPLTEIQARWASRVISGKCHLPSVNVMTRDIKSKKEDMEEKFIRRKRCTIQVSSIAYKDEVADQIGCKPSLFRLLFTDPFLALLCFFGPCTPSQYRLHGPGAWSGARDAIISACAEISPTKPKPQRGTKGHLKRCIVQVIRCVLIDVATSTAILIFNSVTGLFFA